MRCSAIFAMRQLLAILITGHRIASHRIIPYLAVCIFLPDTAHLCLTFSTIFMCLLSSPFSSRSLHSLLHPVSLLFSPLLSTPHLSLRLFPISHLYFTLFSIIFSISPHLSLISHLYFTIFSILFSISPHLTTPHLSLISQLYFTIFSILFSISPHLTTPHLSPGLFPISHRPSHFSSYHIMILLSF
jgi:hypothetical protein